MNTFALAENKERRTLSGTAARCIICVEVGLRFLLTAAEVQLLAAGLRYRLLQAMFFCLRRYFQLRKTFQQVLGQVAGSRGCLMEIHRAIVVEAPLLVPLGAAFGIDPVRLGIIFLENMELGHMTPPVGLNLPMSSYRFGKPVPEVLRAVLPVIVVLSIGVLLITYIPARTTALPRWLGQ